MPGQSAPKPKTQKAEKTEEQKALAAAQAKWNDKEMYPEGNQTKSINADNLRKEIAVLQKAEAKARNQALKPVAKAGAGGD